jgi:hypothetical protein
MSDLLTVFFLQRRDKNQPAGSVVWRRAALWVGSLALAFALAASLPLFNSGFLHTRAAGDSPNLLVRLQQLTTVLRDGVFPVRWMPDAAYGYGYPFFNYYASLPLYLAALLKLYGFTLTESIKLTQIAGFGLAAIGMFGWIRAQGAKRPVALLASAAYTLAPFHLVNVYVRGDSLSEFWAMAWYPFILWAAWRLIRRPSLARVVGLALPYSLLVLTHNISALTFTPFVLLYLAAGWLPSLLKLWRSHGQARLAARLKPGARVLGLMALALAWALALSVFFWLPALLETRYVQTEGLISGFFNFANHFRSANLVQNSWLFDFSTASPAGHTPFAMGLLQTVFIGLGLVAGGYWAWKRKQGAWLLGVISVEFAIATLMITPLSRLVWDHLPLLPLVQFPWRFLSIQALFGAALTGQIVAPALWHSRRAGPAGRAQRLGLAVVCAGTLALSTIPALHLDFLPLTDADVTAQRLQWYEYLSGSIGSTVGSEYLPLAVRPRPFSSDEMLGRSPRLKVLSGEAQGDQQQKRSVSQTWAITVTSPSAVVALPLYYWPGWRAQADGRPLNVGAAPSLGDISFELPQGQHQVTVWLGNTPLRAWTTAASMLAWLALAGLLVGLLWRSRPVLKRAWVFPRLKIGLGGLACLAAGYALLQVRPAAISVGPLNADFQAQAYFYPAPVLFADGRQLKNYAYSSDLLRPGDTLTVTLDGLTDATLALASPATTLFSIAPFTQTTTGVMTIPNDVPPGLYYILLSRPVTAVMGSGLGRSAIHLKPLIIVQSAPAAETGQQLSPRALRVRLEWTGQEFTQNYGLTLRLFDAAGNKWLSLDPPVAYGVYPTGMWQAHELIADRYDLPLPAGTPPGDYLLTASLYDIATLAVVQTHSLTVTLPLVSKSLPLKLELTPDIGMNSIEAAKTANQGETLEIMARWVTQAAPRMNYRALWTLTGPAETLTQTTDLAPGSRPSQWPAGAFVLGRLSLPIAPAVTPGRYALSVVLVDDRAQPVGQPVAVGQVQIAGVPHVFTVPPLKTPLVASFGGLLKLWGYDYAGAGQLTLTWGALAAPQRDYKFFVHLFGATDNIIAAQVDAMPHNDTYPTSHWLKGEVVTDTVRLNLTNVSPGDYRLAVGWYDGNGRLPAVNASNQPLTDDQVVLPETLHIP